MPQSRESLELFFSSCDWTRSKTYMSGCAAGCIPAPVSSSGPCFLVSPVLLPASYQGWRGGGRNQMSAKETCPFSGTVHSKPISDTLPVNMKGLVSGLSRKGAPSNSRINLCALCVLSRTLWRSWQGAPLMLQRVHGWLCGQAWGWPGCHHPSPTSPTAWPCTTDSKAWTWE